MSRVKDAGAVIVETGLGRWDVARRKPPTEVAFRNGWGIDPGLDAPGPLWP